MNDPLYKRLLDHRRIIKDLILGFIAPLRPPGWADSLDFDSLREGPTEQVTDDLRRRLSDVVWSIDRRAADGSAQTMQVLHARSSRPAPGSAEPRSLLETACRRPRLALQRPKHSRPAPLPAGPPRMILSALGQRFPLAVPARLPQT